MFKENNNFIYLHITSHKLHKKNKEFINRFFQNIRLFTLVYAKWCVQRTTYTFKLMSLKFNFYL